MNHAELVTRAEKWLRNTKRCSVVITELRTFHYETPDAIGWHSIYSILVECKTSRGDFFADKHKWFRRGTGADGVGTFRYFLVPDGLVHPHEVPPMWGLVYVPSRGKMRTLKAARRFPVKNVSGEADILRSALRRVQSEHSSAWVRGRGDGI